MWDSLYPTSCSLLFWWAPYAKRRSSESSNLLFATISILTISSMTSRCPGRAHDPGTNTGLERKCQKKGPGIEIRVQQRGSIQAASHSYYFTSRNCCVFLAASSLCALLLRSSWYSLQFMLAWITLHVKQFGWLHTGQWKVLTLSSYTHHPWQFGVLQWKLLGAWLSAVARLRFKNLLKSSGERSYINK